MKTIRKPGEYTPYILIRLAADCFKRTIFFYRDEFIQVIPKDIFLPFNQKEIILRELIKLLFQDSCPMIKETSKNFLKIPCK